MGMICPCIRWVKLQHNSLRKAAGTNKNAMFDTCFEYDDHLRANGHWAVGEVLQGPETALTLSWKNGEVATTDGPYAESKEQLGGIHIVEARDLNHAIQLMSQHPGMKYGSIEIRPVADLSEMMRESERRREKGYLAMRAATSSKGTTASVAGIWNAAGADTACGLGPKSKVQSPRWAHIMSKGRRSKVSRLL
jgi:hypothetical protein